ncbi:MAG: UbiA family prenyltransferase [Thermoplasmata archaeon]
MMVDNQITNSLRAYFKLMRPGNCIMSALGVFTGAVVASGLEFINYPLQIIFASLAAMLVTGAGNALNDYYDKDVDKKNHPDRPIPSGAIKPSSAFHTAWILFAVGIVLSIFVNVVCILVAIFNSILLVMYEKDLKAKGLIGNVSIAYLVSSIFLFGGAAVNSLFITFLLVLTSFFATLGREIIKDVEDVEGDIGRRTLPMIIGKRKSNYFASISILSAIALSPLPYYLFSLFTSILYVVIVFVADAIFIYAIGISFSKPKEASRMTKLGMFVALIAFLAGGLVG